LNMLLEPAFGRESGIAGTLHTVHAQKKREQKASLDASTSH
jgi:hypothetical protein